MPIPASRLTADLRQHLAAIHAVATDAHLVGGAVRDLLDGREPHDLDVVTTADARVVAQKLAERLEANAFALDAERGAWRVVLDGEGAFGEIDVSTISESLDADLRRRDFTVDAMAAQIEADGTLGALLDPTGGQRDLEARRIRMVSREGLVDDALRMLRAVRLSVELGLTIERETADAIADLAPTLNQAAAERQRDELLRILETPRAAEGVRLMDELGLLHEMLPELDPSRDCDQPPSHHFYNVFNHLIETLSSLDVMLTAPDVPKHARQAAKSASWFTSLFARDEAVRPSWFAPTFRRELRWNALDDYLDAEVGNTSRGALIKLSGLLHDVSKPETKTVEANGKTRFLGHPELGAVKASNICRRLRFGGKEIEFVSTLVEEHLRPFQLSNHAIPSERAIFRFFRDAGEATPGVLILALADASAAVGPRLQPERWRNQIAYLSFVLDSGLSQREVVEVAPRLLTGNDLIRELHLEPGPSFGPLLAAVEEAHATGQIESREEALALVRQMASESNNGASGL